MDPLQFPLLLGGGSITNYILTGWEDWVCLCYAQEPSLVSHSFTHSFVHSFIHSVIQSVSQSVSHSVIQSFIHSFIHSFTQSFSHSVIQSFIRSFIHSVSHSVMQSFIHSVIHSFLPSFVPSFLPSFLSSFIHSFIHSLFGVRLLQWVLIAVLDDLDDEVADRLSWKWFNTGNPLKVPNKFQVQVLVGDSPQNLWAWFPNFRWFNHLESRALWTWFTPGLNF